MSEATPVRCPECRGSGREFDPAEFRALNLPSLGDPGGCWFCEGRGVVDAKELRAGERAEPVPSPPSPGGV